MLHCRETLKNESRRCSFFPSPSCALTSPPNVGACGGAGEQVAVAVLFALWRLLRCSLLLCLPCSACFAVCCYCMTAGWGATEVYWMLRPGAL